MRPVLIVDDSLTVRMDLEEAFAAGGFRPALCADLAAARRALSAARFALVVLDVLLPDGDGLELLAELKCSPEHGATPVVLLSTEAEVQHRIKGLQIGADEYVGKPYDAAQVVARARELVRRAEGPTAAGDASRRGPVLLVDDSPTAREEMRAALEQAGLEVVTAASGEEGLRMAAGLQASAVVVDGVMSGMDGASFVQRLRSDPALRTTPCILLTASGLMGELQALEAGADAYVRKEAGRQELLLARLQALLRRSIAIAVGAPAGQLAPKRVLAFGAGAAPPEAVTEQLRQDGHDVVVAASAAEALELLEVDTVDGLVVDVAASLPGALAACREVKANPRLRELPLVLFGEADEHALMVEAVAAGADDYVSTARGLEVLRVRVHAQLRRKQLEDENRARDAYARNAAILETITDAFFAVDRRWRFVYVNHALELLLGGEREALTGAPLWELCPWLGDEALRRELERASAESQPVTFEARAPDERWFEVRAFPHAGGLTAYLRDVTERRRSQEVQAHMLGIVGHDLRTPLTALTASAGMVLRDRTLPDKHRRALERVSAGAARMSRLINDLLDYSRARLGHGLPVVFRPAHLGTICQEAVQEIQAAYPGRVIEHRQEGDGSGIWDPDRIQQVVLNLLTNAVRYGTPDAPVMLRWSGRGDERVLSVHNEGPPIPASLRDHMFEPFKRGDAHGNSWGGVGLGLFIVREIVRAHRGRVVMRSEERVGTTFEVTLPARASPHIAPKST